LINNDEDPIGEEFVTTFVQIIGITDLTHLITYIQQNELKDFEIDGFGPAKKKIFSNLVTKIKNNIPFEYLLKAQFDNIGTSISKQLASYPAKWWTERNLIEVSIERFPDRVREDLIKNIVMIQSWFSHIENISFNKPKDKSTSIEVAVTGAVSVPRKEFEKLLEINGIILKSINKKSNYLICNEKSSSSKYIFAEKNGIPIITEEQFYKLLLKRV
jgi:NAD-dependent DNA ligase